MIEILEPVAPPPAIERSLAVDRLDLFQVWIDVNCGTAAPDWWWNSPPQPLAQALDEAAEARRNEWICQVLPEGVNPRPDGRWDNPP
jgi:hypothetical protein